MKRDMLIVSMVIATVFLAIVGSMLVIVESNNFSDQDLLRGQVVPSEDALAAEWNSITAGTTVVYVEHSTVVIERPVEEVTEPETVKVEEEVVEPTALEILLDDLEQVFNDIDNVHDELYDIEGAVVDADEKNDLDDLDDDLDDLERYELDDLDDLADDIRDRFEDMTRSEYNMDRDEWEAIEKSIDNAHEDINDLDEFWSDIAGQITTKYNAL
jgi:peptidoglycan hydrolase CwlO-like protein